MKKADANDPAYMARARERFMAKVEIEAETGCWLWRGGLSSNGYGLFGFNGSMRGAHRVVHTLFGDVPIPEGMDAAHDPELCPGMRRHCVNPAHSRPATRKENLYDNPSFWAHRTHCPRGHPYEGENLSILPNGKRQCRECNREFCRQQRNKSGEKSRRSQRHREWFKEKMDDPQYLSFHRERSKLNMRKWRAAKNAAQREGIAS